MGRAGLHYTDVEKAIQHLQSISKNPTVDNIRHHLGTGSKSTIAKYLKEWKSHNGIDSQETTTLPSDLLAQVTNLWEHLQQKSDVQLRHIEQESDQKLQQARQEALQLRNQLSEQQQQVHVLEEKLQQETSNHQNINQHLAREQLEKATLQERNQRLSKN